MLENVVFDPDTRICDFDDESKTENTRSAYPLEFIPNASRTGRAGMPKNIVMLTADAFGVMPPIAKLTPAQAMYHFLSGYTAKVAGTEKGLVGVQPEFSTCFGAPFLPRHPSVYGNLLRELIAVHDVDCWLVNTGWTGGKLRRRPPHADQGDAHAADRRARRLADATPSSAPIRISASRCRPRCRGVEPHLLYPFKTWQNKAEFDETARKLVAHVPEELRAVRDPRRRRRARRAAGSADRRGITRATRGGVPWREAVPAAHAANYLQRPPGLARPAQGADPRARAADHRSAPSSVGPRRLALPARRTARRHQQRATTSSPPCSCRRARCIAPTGRRR